MNVQPRTPWTWVVAIAMIVGPLLLVASAIAFVNGDGLNSDELGGALLVYGMAAMAVAGVGLIRAIEPVFPRFAALLLILALFGCAGGAGFGIDSIHAALGAENIEDSESTLGIVGLMVPGGVFPFAFAALGATMWRARVAPGLSGPLLVVAGLMFPVGNIPDIGAIAVAANALFAAALWPAAITTMRRGQIVVEAAAGEQAAGSPHVSTATTG